MSSLRPHKRTAPGDHPALFLAAAAGGLLVVVAAMIAYLSAVLAGLGHGSPAAWLAGQGGAPRWSPAATWCAVLLVVILASVAVPVGVIGVRWWRSRVWTDQLAPSMSTRRDLAEMTEKQVAADTDRLGASHAGTGVRVGKAVLTHEWLYSTFEWSQLWIFGTRAGKTRSIAIPSIMGHRGPVISTSNKPDVVIRTRGPRSEIGRVWVNDPQGVAKEEASWWCDLLAYVTNVERAKKLVAVWASARTTDDTAGLDPYFEPEGRRVASAMVMALALSGEPLTRVSDWLTGRDPRPGVPDPTKILREHGYTAMAASIEGALNLDQGQRDGLYGTARSFFGFLEDPRFVSWIAPTGPDDDRPRFDADEFVRSPADTLYLLSKEGEGSARAITGALVAAVYAAAEEYAEERLDRVPTPVLFVLDEAANICRWPELPQLYSHAGGKGIILITILQSVPQGERSWGKGGFGEMWSAANLLVCGRGLNDGDTLGSLARLVGDRQVGDQSVSSGGHSHRSVSRNNREERIFTEADLRALPRGRAILLTSGARPILLENVDYSAHEWAWKVEESKRFYGDQRGIIEQHADQDKAAGVMADA